MFRNDGVGTNPPVEYDSAGVRGRKTKTDHLVNVFPFGSEGLTFTYYLKVFTTEGETQSLSVSYILAAIPDKPTLKPELDPLMSGKDRIRVTMQPVLNDGNSPILSYSLEMDNGLGGQFIPQYGFLTNSLSL